MTTLDPEFSAPETAQMERIYMEAFPAAERRPWGTITAPEHPCGPRLRAVRADGRLVGMVTTWHFDEFTYVEHLAIDPAMRGGGIGAEVVAALLAEGMPVVLEVERPEEFAEGSDEQRTARRRIGFYERCGLAASGHDYVQPPYGPGLPSLPMWLMMSAPVDAQLVENTLHRHVYGR